MPPLTLTPIGRIETPYRTLADCPRNVFEDGPACRIVLDPAYAAGLEGLVAGRRILVLYWLGEADRSALRQVSRKTGEPAGVFALRTPNRPNPIGAAKLVIDAVDGHSLQVRGLDCLNGTPLLDIKPAMDPTDP